MIEAFRLMYRAHAPDWIILLSGSDYPIMPAATIRCELAESAFDANICYQLVDTDRPDRYQRYIDVDSPVPTPFCPAFRCYTGEFWFSANRRAAEHVLRFHDFHPDFVAYYETVPHPEESYFQCILVNAATLKPKNDPLRYIDWSTDGDHPKTLGMADLRKLRASSAHFARKFEIETDAAVLDILDREIGIAA